MNRPQSTVGCYYFPNYHTGDERNNACHGDGWSEWELVKAAQPRFPGHRQPKRPLWGYENEADPAVMARKIETASAYGIDYFIFDYYCYDDGTFLERCLNDGFLGAPNVDRMKFALMWANHDWLDIHPCGRRPRNLLYPGKVKMETFRAMGKRLIERYFHHPSYFRIDGAPYFSIYYLQSFIDDCGGIDGARRELDGFRRAAEAAGLPGLHLNGILWGRPVLPCEGKPVGLPEAAAQIGLDSATSYVWVHHVPLGQEREIDYCKIRDGYFVHWRENAERYPLPYYPNVTIGWDSSPRTLMTDRWTPDAGYPYTPVVTGNTPERFREALTHCAARMAELKLPTMNINCWNEWTEGSMLEPEAEYGYGYLEAVRSVFRP